MQNARYKKNLGGLRKPPRACFQSLYLPVYCSEDPPQPPLKRGENERQSPPF